MEKRPYKRKIRNYLINPKYQFKILMWLFAASMLFASVQLVIFYGAFMRSYRMISGPVNPTPEIRRFLYEEINRLAFTLGGANLLCLLGVALVSIILSHRIVGPMYHIMRVCKEVTGGDTGSRIHLRDHDEFQEVAAVINEMLESLTAKK